MIEPLSDYTVGTEDHEAESDGDDHRMENLMTETTTLILATAHGLYGLAFLLLGGAILRQHGLRQPAGRLLLLYILVALLGTLGEMVVLLPLSPFPGAETLDRAVAYGPLLLSFLFLCLSWRFLEHRRCPWTCWLPALTALVGSIVLGEGNLLLPPEWASLAKTAGRGAATLTWGVLTAFAAAWTLRARRRADQPLHRNRIAYWSLALLLTVVGAGLTLLGLTTAGHGFYLLGALVMAYALLTYSLPDVRRMGRRLIGYLIVALLSAVVYAAVFWTAQALVHPAPGYDVLAATAGAALFLALLADPLLTRLQKAVERKLSGAAYDPGQTLRQYSTSISNIPDLERLATAAIGLISEAMEIRRGALFIVRREADEEGEVYYHLRGVTGMGEDQPPGRIAATGPVAVCLAREHRPLSQYDIDLLPRFRDIPEEERAWWSSLKMDVYVPIYAQGEWIGLLALGPKVSGDRYFEEDLRLLSTLADQTAVALQNARLFDDLRLRNMENERLNRELTAANEQLVRLDKAKSDFINIASHELRTPLTKIRGYNDLLAELIRHGSLTAESAEQMIEGVRNAVRQLEEIAKTMFDVSKIETETLSLNLWPTSLETVIQTVANRWREALRERNLNLITGGLMDLPTIIADGERLEQVFDHLLQNAIKFTPDGGTIRIMGALRDGDRPPEEQAVEITVGDTGIGIAPEDLERIFEKFYRVGDVMLHSTGRTKFMGAGPGLGLTVVRGIVEAHGGKVWAESPGRDKSRCPGATFHVVLPCRPRKGSRSGKTIRPDDTTVGKS